MNEEQLLDADTEEAQFQLGKCLVEGVFMK